MATLNKFNRLTKDFLDGTHKLGTDAIKVLLTNTLPVVANALKADVTEIAAGNGYTAGGLPVTLATSTASGLAKLTATDLTITATGAIGPFRYAVLTNSSVTGGPLIGWIDLGQETLANGDTLLIDFDNVNGLFTL